MRKILVYVIMLIVLGTLTLYLSKKNRDIYRFSSEEQFRLTSTGQVSRIRLYQGEDTILLVNRDHQWRLNREYSADAQKIERLLSALSGWEIQSQIPENNQGIHQEFRNASIVMELYGGQKQLKKYELLLYKDDHRVFMGRADGSGGIYRLQAPELITPMASLLTINPHDWLDKTLIHLLPHELSLVRIHYPQQSQSSFIIRIPEDNPPGLYDINNNALQEFNRHALNRYLGYFQHIKFEKAFLRSDSLADSLKNKQEHISIRIRTRDNQTRMLRLYRIALPGQERPYDLNYCYIMGNTNPQLVKVKYLEIDPILKQQAYFLQP